MKGWATTVLIIIIFAIILLAAVAQFAMYQAQEYRCIKKCGSKDDIHLFIPETMLDNDNISVCVCNYHNSTIRGYLE